MSQVNNVSSIMGGIDLGHTGSLQFQFAKLQLALSQIAMSGALDYMNKIEKSQDDQKKVFGMLQQVNQAQANAKASGSADLPKDILAYMKDNNLAVPAGSNAGTIKQLEEVLARCKQLQQDAINGKGNCPWDKKASMMTPADEKFLKDNGIAFDTTGNDRAHNPTEWAFNIKQMEKRLATLKPYTAGDLEVIAQSLKSSLDHLGTDTQQKMVFVHDFMGQYNSYLQGVNSLLQQAKQTLAELARLR